MFDRVICVGDTVNVNGVENKVGLVVVWWLCVVHCKEEVFPCCW